LTTSVLIDGVPAPLFFTSAGQIDAQMPFEWPGPLAVSPPGTNAGVQVTVNDSISPVLGFVSSAVAPGIYVAINANGTGQAPNSPAKPGDYLTVYVTGLGAVSNQPADGAASPANPLASATATVTATIGGQTANVSFAGLVPGSVAFYQVNVQVPNLANGTYPLVITQGGVQNSNKYQIAVSN